MALELLRLDGKVAMVTGGGRGVGKDIALVMAEAGAKIAICARSQDQLDQTVREIEAAGGEALAVRADVTREPDLKSFTDATLKRFGKIDCLVNNAGGNEIVKPFFQWSHDEFIEIMRWNLSGAFILSQLVGRHMIAAGSGTIVNISSEAGRFPGRGLLPYGVAKGGLNQFTATLAAELAPKVRVNTLILGPIMTPLLKSVLDQDQKFWAQMVENVPLKTIGDPRCVALATVFLCSDASSYITGAALPVSGGIPGDVTPFKLPDL